MPRTLAYSVVDAFTSTPFKGNPAAVIILPSDGAILPDSTQQQIAAEFNLSETAFLVPQTSTQDGGATYGLRWFTPTLEVALCGHATLASARVIFASEAAANINELRFETLSGTLVAKRVPGGGTIELDFPEVKVEDVTADEAVKITRLVTEAFGELVGIKVIKKGPTSLLVHVDPRVDLEAAMVNASSFVRLLYLIRRVSLTFTFCSSNCPLLCLE